MAVPLAVGRPQKSAVIRHTRSAVGSGGSGRDGSALGSTAAFTGTARFPEQAAVTVERAHASFLSDGGRGEPAVHDMEV